MVDKILRSKIREEIKKLNGKTTSEFKDRMLKLGYENRIKYLEKQIRVMTNILISRGFIIRETKWKKQ